jgi:hypothetical protein
MGAEAVFGDVNGADAEKQVQHFCNPDFLQFLKTDVPSIAMWLSF